MSKWVYSFGDGKADGTASMKNLLGGKGANLAEMSSLGLPVPPGFTLTTDVCDYYTRNDNTYPNALKAEVAAALIEVEATTGLKFGESKNTLRKRIDLGVTSTSSSLSI